MLSLNIRSASLAAGDGEVLSELWESQRTWLISVGSAEQFGTMPFCERWPGTDEAHRTKVAKSEASEEQPFTPDWCRIFIADVDPPPSQGSKSPTDPSIEHKRIPVAAVILEGECSNPAAQLSQENPSDRFMFMAYLMSNRHAGALSKGAGAELIAYAKRQAHELGLSRLCVICWSGNERRLVRYYESHGFVALRDFIDEDVDDWPGTVLEMRF